MILTNQLEKEIDFQFFKLKIYKIMISHLEKNAL